MDALIRQLKRWQTRERLLRLAWGVARLVAVVAMGLFVACSIDWIVDRYRETPFLLRFAMTTVQLAAFGAAAYVFPDKPILLQYTTTSPRLHKLLGVEQPAFD